MRQRSILSRFAFSLQKDDLENSNTCTEPVLLEQPSSTCTLQQNHHHHHSIGRLLQEIWDNINISGDSIVPRTYFDHRQRGKKSRKSSSHDNDILTTKTMFFIVAIACVLLIGALYLRDWRFQHDYQRRLSHPVFLMTEQEDEPASVVDKRTTSGENSIERGLRQELLLRHRFMNQKVNLDPQVVSP